MKIKPNSILFKLLLFTVIVLIASMSLLLFFSHYQLGKIVDASENEVYSERIDSIIGILSRGNRRLNERDDRAEHLKEYQQIALITIRNRYHETEGHKIYPFVINATDRTFVHSTSCKKCGKEIKLMRPTFRIEDVETICKDCTESTKNENSEFDLETKKITHEQFDIVNSSDELLGMSLNEIFY